MSSDRTRWAMAVLVVSGLCVCTLAAQAATGPVHSPPAQVSSPSEPAADQVVGHPIDKRLLLSTRRWLDGESFSPSGGLRDTGVCDPPVGGPEPIGCTTNGDCAGFGPETCGTNGFCDYPPITTCGSDDDCVGKGTGHCLDGFCEDQNYHYCRDPGHTNEGEWDLPTNGCGFPQDWHNSGCSWPYVWGSLSCGETLCGTATRRSYSGSTVRDNDWYKLAVTEPTRITIHATAEFEFVFGFAHNHGIDDCAVFDAYYWGGHYAVPDACVKDSATACVHPGTWWIAVAPLWNQTIPCLDYELTVECEAPCHVACCIGNNICVETDEDTCELVYGQIAAADDCTPGLCAWDCPGQNKPCNSYTQVDNSVNSDVMNPAPSCGAGANVGTLWFWFTAEYDSVQVSTCNSVGAADDSVFALYAGDCTDTLTELACSEDEDCWAGDWLGVIDYCNLIIGDTYYIQLASWSPADQGVYHLDITCPAWPCSGACCLSDGSCVTTSASYCDELDGQYQGPGMVCLGDADSNGIDDECELGACCTTNWGCVPTSHDFCLGPLGGVDFLPGEQCPEQPGDFDPCIGACCRWVPTPPPPTAGYWECTEGPEALCLGDWYSMEECGSPGGDPPWFQCPDDAVCPLHPEEDANCQEPSEDAVEGATGTLSDEDPWIAGGVLAQRAADDFIPLASGISMVCFWGFYAELDENAIPPAPECDIADDHFTISYYTDNNGCPGTLHAQYSQKDVPPTLTVVKTTAGWRAPNAANSIVYEFEGIHASLAVAIGDCYWLEIVNDTGAGSCAWAWVPSPYAEGDGYSVDEFGLPGSTAEWDCAPGVPDTTDQNRHDLAWCLSVANTPCDFCRPLRPGTPEGEPVCYDEYVDTYNNGCNECPDGEACTTDHFTDIACGQVVRGTYGTYEGHPSCDTAEDCDPLEECIGGKCTGDTVNFRDTDWYRFTLTEQTTVDWCVYGPAPVLSGVIHTYGIDACPPNIMWAGLAQHAACIEHCANAASLGAGTWYGYVATSAFVGAPCGTEYEVCLDCGNGCAQECVAEAVRSYKYHGGPVSAELCVDLGVWNGVESRIGQIDKLEVDMDTAASVSVNDVVTVNCNVAYGGACTVTAKDGNTVTVECSGALPDEAYCVMDFDCGAQICVRNCEGDCNGDGMTNTSDASAAKVRFGQPVTGCTDGNARWDWNRDGVINSTDFSQLKLRFGKSVASCP